ncbi:hypothetical protein ACHAWF_001532 [Thalassiosira exigua]
MSFNDLKNLHNNKNLVKKLVNITISLLSPSNNMQEKIDEVKSTIKFQMKKVMRLNVVMGSNEMEKQQITVNTQVCGKLPCKFV